MIHLEASCLFSGTADYPIYADRLCVHGSQRGLPIIMIHGACNTGACFLVTPDGRPGWAHDFALAGFDTYVIDWPGHGRSPMRRGFKSLSTSDVRDATAELLEQIGPAIVLAHSAGGPVAWSLAEQFPEGVIAIVGVAPGPPANLVRELASTATSLEGDGAPIVAPEEELFWVDQSFVERFWFSGVQAPPQAAQCFFRSVVPESPRILNERFNVAGQGLWIHDPAVVARRPILIVTGDSDPRHPRALDAKTAELFGADFYWLPDLGIHGNGHMLMGDRNSRHISTLIVKWLLEAITDARTPMIQRRGERG